MHGTQSQDDRFGAPDALLEAWRPRHTESGGVDIIHSVELSKALAGEIEALGFASNVAECAANHFVNHQTVRGFDLWGSHHADHLLAARAAGALICWIGRKTAPRSKAA
jgi:hypothetical protein